MNTYKKSSIDERETHKKIGEALYNILKENCPIHKDILFFCIGTEKVKGDNIGPFIGSLLKERKKFLGTYGVEGVLQDNITAINIEEKLEGIPRKNTFVIAIDATLSNRKIGTILLRKGSLMPGLGLGKHLKKSRRCFYYACYWSF